jgi:serine/threonine protein kinase
MSFTNFSLHEQNVCREALMWRSLNHKFLLPFSGIYKDESASQFSLVSPYMENGTLAQWRKMANPLIADIERLVGFASIRSSRKLTLCEILEVAQGIAYIHAEGAVHGDICGVFSLKYSMLRYADTSQANVLLDDEFHAQIADFGLTRLSEDPDTQTSALHYNFAAPELFGCFEEISHSNDDAQPMVKTYKSDVYAFGCLYYEVGGNKHASAISE